MISVVNFRKKTLVSRERGTGPSYLDALCVPDPGDRTVKSHRTGRMPRVKNIIIKCIQVRQKN